MNKRECDSISIHSFGSIKISHHADRMENELKRLPTVAEVYEKTHFSKKTQESISEYITPKAGKVMDAYLGLIVDKYGDDTNSHPPFDRELWSEASGGVKKGKRFGWGLLSDPARLLVHFSATSSGSTDNLENITQLKEEFKELKELKTQFEELNAKSDEIEANRQAVEASRQEVKKILDEVRKLAGRKTKNIILVLICNFDKFSINIDVFILILFLKSIIITLNFKYIIVVFF